jgi:serine/threonine-protein kinase
MAEAQAPSAVSGLQFGRYELLLKMASGGMATLYLARLTGPERFEKLLCIKKIHDHLADEKEFTDMFLDECRIAALIHHPNVASVFDMGRIQGAYFMALEYIHGQDLRALLAAAKRLPDGFPWAYAARIVADAAAGLHAAHELRRPGGTALGVVHRDVSHQNLLISYDGIVKVVDFGIAYARERIASTGVKTLKGKIAYMSPEQSEQKPLDRRSDVFSLGTVLYEAVCLKRLFKSDSEVETILKVREARVPRPRTVRPEIPERLEKIILQALARDPEDRYQTAAHLQGALEALLVEESQVVGQQQIADLMGRLFHSKRQEKDRRIEEVLETGSGGLVPHLAFGGVGDESLTRVPSAERPLGRWLRRNRGLVLGSVGGFAVVLLAILGAFWLGGRGRSASAPAASVGSRAPPGQRSADPRPPGIPPGRAGAARAGRAGATPPPPPRRPDAAVPATVSLVVKVKPERARVRIHFRGKTHRGHTLRAQLERSDQEETVRIRARGYRRESLVVVPLEDRTFEVTLKRRRRYRHRPRIRWKSIPD